MIGYLHGRVIALYTDYCLLDVHGVGYRVFLANSTRAKLRLKEEASLFTYTSVREDAIVLYGFATEEEYGLFLQLIGVSGIGKKSAERLILELKDKVAFADSGEEELLTIENEAEVGDDAVAEAMAALQSLGYTQAEIAPVIRKTAKYKTTEAIIKASLKELSHM